MFTTKRSRYYKAGQLLLQSGPGIIKWGQSFVSRVVQKTNERIGGGQYSLETDSLIHT